MKELESYLERHREAFEEQSGIAVSASTVGREIARLPGFGRGLARTVLRHVGGGDAAATGV